MPDLAAHFADGAHAALVMLAWIAGAAGVVVVFVVVPVGALVVAAGPGMRELRTRRAMSRARRLAGRQ